MNISIENYANKTNANIIFKSAMLAFPDALTKTLTFPAFLTSFSDNYTSNWNEEQVYGRQDPIGNFQSTQRKISVGWNILAEGIDQAEKNLGSLNVLKNLLYPTYSNKNNALTLAKAPLMFVKFANIITDTASKDGFLLCYITSFNANPVLDMGMFTREGKLFPKVYEVTAEITPQHRGQLGFVGTIKSMPGLSGSSGINFPYDGGKL